MSKLLSLDGVGQPTPNRDVGRDPTPPQPSPATAATFVDRFAEGLGGQKVDDVVPSWMTAPLPRSRQSPHRVFLAGKRATPIPPCQQNQHCLRCGRRNMSTDKRAMGPSPRKKPCKRRQANGQAKTRERKLGRDGGTGRTWTPRWIIKSLNWSLGAKTWHCAPARCVIFAPARGGNLASFLYC